MLLMKWDELPENMKNDEVREYYDILKRRTLNLLFKRMYDIILSLILIVLLFPILILVAIWIKLDSKGAIFYRQERVTQFGKVFKINKFRTMIVNADKIGSLVTVGNDKRITKVGDKIRKYRIDEMPQLFNVLKGEMSFVGTRPEVTKYVSLYKNEMYATLLLPAGITSLASINFRSEDEMISSYTMSKDIDAVYLEKILPKKMEFNLQYLKKVNMKEDMILCIKTLI